MNRYLISVSLLTLLGCSGGGGTPVSWTSTPPANPTLNPEGIWTGTLKTSDGSSLSAIAMVLSTGEMRYVASNGLQASGTLSISGASFTGAGTLYAPTGSTFTGGGTTTAFTVAGSGTTGTSMTGTYTSAADSGTMTFTYNTTAAYSTPVVMANVAGSYVSVITNSGRHITGALTAAGVFSGNDGQGSFTGALSAVDSTKNAFRITITYTPTGQAPLTYAGLSFFDFSRTPLRMDIQATGITGQFAGEFGRTGP